eukprot:1155106-Pelagomonas_calceolata.AAC.8
MANTLIPATQQACPARRIFYLSLLSLELQSFSYHPALFLVAGPVLFLCLPYFSQSELRSREVTRYEYIIQDSLVLCERVVSDACVLERGLQACLATMLQGLGPSCQGVLSSASAPIPAAQSLTLAELIFLASTGQGSRGSPAKPNKGHGDKGCGARCCPGFNGRDRFTRDVVLGAVQG